MRAYDLILKKRKGEGLNKQEIDFLIKGFVDGLIPDYQMAAFAMAVYFKGLSLEETVNLTHAMLNSGDVIDLSSIDGCKVDKHSTGGVGDTITLALVPLVAAVGVPVVKLSGRGLGHTGGTIDKLESIPGFQVEFSQEQIINMVNKTGAVIAGQTGNIVPADKKLYALRDVTATVDINSFIASSVMSKKIASGCDKIVLDVKLGKGAFIKSIDDAIELAKTMVEIGHSMGRETVAYITNMDQPLGYSIGNSIEVKEAINILKGKIEGPLLELTLELSAEMLVLAGKCKTRQEAVELLQKTITNGKALSKFAEIIENQGGNPDVIEDFSIFKDDPQIDLVCARTDGYISFLDAEKIGFAAMSLGAGRERKDQKILLDVGIRINKKIGDKVNAGEKIAVIYSRKGHNLEYAKKLLDEATIINKETIEKPPLIYGRITKNQIKMY
jgi:pyrimidine-nucleoside phosphorylase